MFHALCHDSGCALEALHCTDTQETDTGRRGSYGGGWEVLRRCTAYTLGRRYVGKVGKGWGSWEWYVREVGTEKWSWFGSPTWGVVPVGVRDFC